MDYYDQGLVNSGEPIHFRVLKEVAKLLKSYIQFTQKYSQFQTVQSYYHHMSYSRYGNICGFKGMIRLIN